MRNTMSQNYLILFALQYTSGGECGKIENKNTPMLYSKTFSLYGIFFAPEEYLALKCQ